MNAEQSKTLAKAIDNLIRARISEVLAKAKGGDDGGVYAATREACLETLALAISEYVGPADS